MSEPTRIDQRPNGCYPAVLSGLTGVPLDELSQDVPDTVNDDDEESGKLRNKLHNELTGWLRQRGWRVECVYLDVPEGFAIACGQSPREKSHAVIVRDGKLWHDPHPSRVGLVTVEYYEVLVPIVSSAYGDVTPVRRSVA